MPSKIPPKKYYTGRYISLSIYLGFLLFVLGLLFWLMKNQVINLPVNDITMYWSSSKLSLSDENIYDPEGLREYQGQVTGTSSDVVLMYSPPWTKHLLLLFGLGDRIIGQLIWLIYYIILNSAYWWLHLRYSDFYFIWFAPGLFIWFIMAELVARYTPKVNKIDLDEA